jgi:hypothetical protein
MGKNRSVGRIHITEKAINHERSEGLGVMAIYETINLHRQDQREDVTEEIRGLDLNIREIELLYRKIEKNGGSEEWMTELEEREAMVKESIRVLKEIGQIREEEEFTCGKKVLYEVICNAKY